MRIHSKYHDYYDSAIAYGIDPNCHYVRKTESFRKDSDEYRTVFKHFGEKNSFSRMSLDVKFPPTRSYDSYKEFVWVKGALLIFCGKLYRPLSVTIGRKTVETSTVQTFYEYGDVIDYAESNLGQKDANRYLYGKSVYYGRKTRAEEFKRWFFMPLPRFTESRIADYHHEAGIPAVRIEEEWVEYNPVLADLNFYRCFDPASAFQEISMFVSGVLGGQSPKMVELEDKDLIAKHGYNDLSFRNEKTKHFNR